MNDEAGKPPTGDDEQSSPKPAAGAAKSGKAGRKASVSVQDADGDAGERDAQWSDVHGRPIGEDDAGQKGEDRPVRPARANPKKVIYVDGKPYYVKPGDLRKIMRNQPR